LEDLVEAVVGEIVDRRDEKSRYTRSGEDVLIASGKLELMELQQLFDVGIKSENHMVTLGGWLTEQMGDIPKSGSKYTYKNLLFHVLSADSKRVRRIYIRRISK
jgi:magnesium and cobalt exporter, CNNM family